MQTPSLPKEAAIEDQLDLLGKHLVTQGESDHKDLFILHLIV